MQKEELDNLREGIETVDQNRPPLRVISGYSVLDHLGTGAFGSVFKVNISNRKHNQEWPNLWCFASFLFKFTSNLLVWWQVQKQSGQNILALKEVNLHNPAFGKDKKSRDSNVEKIISELTIIKEQALGSIQITSELYLDSMITCWKLMCCLFISRWHTRTLLNITGLFWKVSIMNSETENS